MPFLTIASITVPVEQGQAVERTEYVGQLSRAFDGSLLSSIRDEKRVWQITTAFLTVAETAALKAAIADAAAVSCAGDMLGGTVTCRVLAGDGPYINAATSDGYGFLRQLILSLHEA